MAVSYLIREPRLLVGLLVLWLLRGLLPPPGALFGALGRAGRLREQVRLNRANITARRDLATIYLSLLRPRRALPLLEEGLALAPNDPELIYLYGVALHRAGRHEEALARLLTALEKDARLRHGHPYFVAGETLLALSRWDDAIDAFERYLDFNGSDVAAHTHLARACAGANDAEAARKWLLGGISTWHSLSGALKRRQFGAYLRAQWARITVLKDTGAMLIAACLLALGVGGVLFAYPFVARLWQPDPRQQRFEQLAQGAALCGSQRTGDFEGGYTASLELDGGGASLSAKPDPDLRKALERQADEQLANFRITSDRIASGRDVVQEFCLTKVLERTPQSLHAEAVLTWRPRQNEAGDADEGQADEPGRPVALFDIRLDRGAESTRLRFAPRDRPLAATLVTLRRQQ